jgi:GT2 family glycosyltransferase
MTLITVVVPSYDSLETIRRCVASICAQSMCTDFETIVFHSGGDDPTDLLFDLPDVSVVHVGPKTLPAVKRNRGVRVARGDYVAFLDADCVADSDWLRRLRETLDALGPDVAGVGGSVAFESAATPVAWAMHMTEFAEWLPSTRAGFRRDFPSCNALYRVDVLRRAGGFPESFFPCEDTALNARLRAQGFRLGFDPSARVTHHQLGSFRALCRKNFLFGRQYALAAARYGLPGSSASRPVFAVPVFAYRMTRLLQRVSSYGRGGRLSRTAAALPICVVFLVAWTIGFTRINCRKEPSWRLDRRC